MKQHRQIYSRWAYIALIFVMLAIFLLSAYKLFGYYTESKESRQAAEQLAAKVLEMNKAETSAEGEYAPLSVDFAALAEENPDIVAWLYCEGTPVNYPVVQAEDNDYYLRRLIDGRWNSSGSLFVDWRNAADFSDTNTVIYGHNMKNDSMLGCLPKYSEQAYYDEHSVFYLLTPAADYKVELFAGYVTSAASEVYTLPLPDDDKAAFIADSVALSDFHSVIEPQADDRILTLSTCSYEYDNARYILLGILKPLLRAE